MLLIIAVLYFLGIQSVASNICPRLRCTSRQDLSPRNVLLRCQLTREPTHQVTGSRAATIGLHVARGPGANWRTLASSKDASTSALVDGVCVSEYFLDHLLPNASGQHDLPAAAASSFSRIQLELKQLSGLGFNLRREPSRMVCNTVTSPTPGSPSAPASSSHDRTATTPSWQQCAQRVPRLEIVETLASNRNAICTLCFSAPGDPEIVYHSISRTLLLRVVFSRGDSSSSSSAAASLSSSSSSISSASSPVASLSVTFDLYFPGPNQPRIGSARRRRPSTHPPRHAPDPSTNGQSSQEVPSALASSIVRCRWKCGWWPICLKSRAHVCDGKRHCPDGLDEAWCQRATVSRETSPDRRAPMLSLPLVYALITIGCILGFVFLILCFLWAFCGRFGPHSGAYSLSQHRRRSHQHRRRQHRHRDGADAHALSGPDVSDIGGDSLNAGPESGLVVAFDCPTCSPCCSSAFGGSSRLCSASSGVSSHERASAGARRGVTMDQPSTGCSSSGVFEESVASSAAVCPRCGSSRQWPGARPGELEVKSAAAVVTPQPAASDSSSAISGYGGADVENGTMETIVCNVSGGGGGGGGDVGQRAAPCPTSNHRNWTPFALGRSRGSSESVLCHHSSQPRHHHHHHNYHHRSSRTPRRHTQFQGQSHTMPSHEQDWYLNLPATVRRSNDDTEPRPVLSPTSAIGGSNVPAAIESGRLLPPPNLNPFLDEPHFRCKVVAADSSTHSAT